MGQGIRRFSVLLALAVASAAVATAGSASPTSFPGPAGKIALSRFGSEAGIDLVNPDGSGRTRIAAAGGYQPTWSADGKWLAYSTSPEPWVIRIVRADGTDDREVLSARAGAPATQALFAWSPSGSEIAYRCTTGICAVRVSDGTTRRVFDTRRPDFVNSPAWSPDGSRIAFACPSGAGLCLVNADGTNPVGFERPPGLLSLLRSPDWSPDGSQLLVSSDAKVHTLDLDDGELRLLVDLGGQILARARWSPDGKSVLLSQFSTVYVMGLDGSAPVKIGDQTASDWGTSPAITVSDARFEPRWVLSRQLGTIVLRGTASHASSVTVTLRSAMRSYPPMPTSIPAGDYTVSVRLRSDLLPGTYEIVVGGISGSERLLDTARSAQLAAPAAGLVARSWISAKPGGAPRDRVDRGPRRLYAHFAFSPRPKKGQRLVAVWLAPSGAVRLRVLVSPAATVRSVIADERGLVSGRWRCRLEVGGAAVAIASIRVG